MNDRLKHILSSRQFTLGFLINLYKDTNQKRQKSNALGTYYVIGCERRVVGR